jgi:hypothetical protein
MKIKVTEKGVYDQKGKRVAVGTVFDVPGGVIPSWLVGKVAIIEGAPAKAQAVPEGKTAITNPAKTDAPAELTEAQLVRQAKLIDIIETLDPNKDFTKDGAAKMESINLLVEKGDELFTAEERDLLAPVSKA